MKKFLLALAVVLTAGISFAAEYNIKWYRGSSFSVKEPISDDMKVVSIGQVYGMFENGETIKVNEGFTATVSGPGLNRTPAISQPTVSKKEPNGDITLILQPGIGFSFTVMPTVPKKDPGEYTAVIPAGAFTVDGVANEEFSVKFIVEDSRTYTAKEDLEFELVEPKNANVQEFTKFSFRISRKVDDEVVYTNEGVKPGAKATVQRTGSDEVLTYDVVTDTYTMAGYFGYMLKIEDKSKLNVPGIYTVTIPEGTVRLGYEKDPTIFYTNTELKFNFGVGQLSHTPQKPILNPEEGEYQALSGIEFEAPEGNIIPLVEENGKVKPIVVTLPDGTKKEFIPENSFNQAYFYLYNPEVFTAAGKYTVSIPKDMFKFYNEEQGEIYTSGFDLEYNVTGGTFKDMECDMLDSSGNAIKSGTAAYKLDFVYVKFKEETTATPRLRAKVVYPDGSVKLAGISWSEANKRFMIDFGFPKQFGKYTVTFPAGAARNENNEFNNSFTFSIEYLEKQQEKLMCTTSPASGSTVGELFDLYLIAPEGFSKIEPQLSGITPTYFYNDEDQEGTKQMQYIQAIDNNDTRMKITLNSPVTEVGDYTWLIPENSIRATKNDGTQVLGKAMTFFWSIRKTGVVDTVLEDETVFNVYTIGGVCVIRNGNRDDLKSLEKGIYIINGKTFIFR